MEKFSQFRDRGTQIAPFLPLRTPRPLLLSLAAPLLFCARLPFFLCLVLPYLLLLHPLPLPSLLRKTYLWSILGVAGVWWIDLQVSGVKRGRLSTTPTKLPAPGCVIAASYTSPLDAVYLAAIFDPVFTVSYPGSARVQRVSLPVFVWRTLVGEPAVAPPRGVVLEDVQGLVQRNPGRIVLVFPECTPTNGRGVLRFAPCLRGVTAKVFPVSLRYSPADVTLPVPGHVLGWVWGLLGRATHCIRVRIGEGVEGEDVGERVQEELARIGRVKRVDLGVAEKKAFLEAWRRERK